jgi:protein-disulfide isomerase/uncharacterized membrane protein
MQSTRAKLPAYPLQLVSSLVGLVTSLYLLVQHTRLKSGIQESASFCSFGRYADCDVVNSSRFSEVAGIPLASIGALFYFTCLCLNLLARPRDKAFPQLQKYLTALVGLGLVVDAGLLGIQIFELKTFCSMCLLTYVSSGAILFASLRLRKRAPAPDGEVGVTRPALWMTGVAAIAFVGFIATLPSYYRLQGQTYAMIENALEQFFRTWRDRPIRPTPVKEGDGVFGNPDSKVRILVFSDFECPHCRKAAFTLHTALKPLKERMLFVFKHFPLDSTCNPKLQYQLHPNACALARLAYCAERKGLFWEYHDLVFLQIGEGVSQGIEALKPQLAPILSDVEIERCLQDEKSLANLKADIELGSDLGLTGTPAVYINGKHVSIPVTVETLKRLVAIEEAAAR